MVKNVNTGLAKTGEIYHNRWQSVQDLRTQGKKVVGYLCLYPVVEMLTALDIIPFRLFGDMKEPISRADKYLPVITCPFLRSLVDLGLKGRYDFLDGVVMAHTCDVGAQISGLWNNYVKTPYLYFIDTPHTTHEAARKHEKEELEGFRLSLESFTGKKRTDQKLREAIQSHNQQRALVRSLYDLRKLDPPLISGVEVLEVLVALMSIPVVEGNQLVTEVIKEVKERKSKLPRKPARLLVWGPVIHETPMIEMIESLDAQVVMDDTCVGSRAYFDDVKITPDPLEGLAYHYLVDLKCPRTFRASINGKIKHDRTSDLNDRFSYLGNFVRDWKVNGVILQSLRYCDSHGYDVPAVKEYLSQQGMPSIYLEHDNTEGAISQLRTRVQGFLEIIG
jgi:benzoyl-CoA reductase subunit C